MLVNLPNGKTVYMTVEQYLALDDNDIQYMISVNCGSTASSPWCGSAIKKPDKIRLTDEDDDTDLTGIPDEELDLDEEQWDPFVQDPEVPESE